MKSIQLTPSTSLRELAQEYSLSDDVYLGGRIGYNGSVYFLFSKPAPEEPGSARYAVVEGTVIWREGRLVCSRCLDLGVHEDGFDFAQPIFTYLLLLKSRARRLRDGSWEKNAQIVNERGKIHNSFCLGDGIADCTVTDNGQILVSYFDEGVSGDSPHARYGLAAFDFDGRPLWENRSHPMLECYAMAVDSKEKLWFSAYPGFELVCVDPHGNRERVYHPEIKGFSKLLPTRRGQLLCDGGYDFKGQFFCMEVHPDGLGHPESVRFESGSRPLQIADAAFRGPFAMLTDADGNLYFQDVIDV